MLTPLPQIYPNHARTIWVLYDLRDHDQCQHLHEQRAVWRELSHLEALGPNHMILIIWPGIVEEVA